MRKRGKLFSILLAVMALATASPARAETFFSFHIGYSSYPDYGGVYGYRQQDLWYDYWPVYYAPYAYGPHYPVYFMLAPSFYYGFLFYQPRYPYYYSRYYYPWYYYSYPWYWHRHDYYDRHDHYWEKQRQHHHYAPRVTDKSSPQHGIAGVRTNEGWRTKNSRPRNVSTYNIPRAYSGNKRGPGGGYQGNSYRQPSRDATRTDAAPATRSIRIISGGTAQIPERNTRTERRRNDYAAPYSPRQPREARTITFRQQATAPSFTRERRADRAPVPQFSSPVRGHKYGNGNRQSHSSAMSAPTEGKSASSSRQQARKNRGQERAGPDRTYGDNRNHFSHGRNRYGNSD